MQSNARANAGEGSQNWSQNRSQNRNQNRRQKQLLWVFNTTAGEARVKIIMAPEPAPHPHLTDRLPGDGKPANAAPGLPRGNPQKTMAGTPIYMSPEVIQGDLPATSQSRHSGAADIWPLGCVILEMSTGRQPWSTLDNEWAIMYNITQGNPPQMPSEDQLSPLGIDFLQRCFARDPAKRSSVAELLLHQWIVGIRRMIVEEPETPMSATSSNSGGSGSSGPSRHNSSVF